MNSASIATGLIPGRMYSMAMCVCAAAKEGTRKAPIIDFSAPAFIEDFGVWSGARTPQGKLTLVSTMLQAAQPKG